MAFGIQPWLVAWRFSFHLFDCKRDYGPLIFFFSLNRYRLFVLLYLTGLIFRFFVQYLCSGPESSIFKMSSEKRFLRFSRFSVVGPGTPMYSAACIVSNMLNMAMVYLYLIKNAGESSHSELIQGKRLLEAQKMSFHFIIIRLSLTPRDDAYFSSSILKPRSTKHYLRRISGTQITGYGER